MLKLLLKHTIFDFALNMMFDKLEDNLKVVPIKLLVGKYVMGELPLS